MSSSKIVVKGSSLAGFNQAVSEHPQVQMSGDSDSPDIHFVQGNWARTILIDSVDSDCRGLVELIDNNPMVCTEVFALPDPLGILGSIAVGPLARAGLIVEEPVLIGNVPGELDNLHLLLADLGWDGGVAYQQEPVETGSAYALTALVKVETQAAEGQIELLYRECFERSFFVRESQSEDWDTALVSGKPFAIYRIRITEGDQHSIVTVQVLSDKHGKCGAAGAIHALNVMVGFEESLPFGG
ncbi:MAG: hypothetical protein J0L72_03645 [Armatimonadetes bacterium]|nr:hypothetical protein [Armatimonadota bacterium]